MSSVTIDASVARDDVSPADDDNSRPGVQPLHDDLGASVCGACMQHGAGRNAAKRRSGRRYPVLGTSKKCGPCLHMPVGASCPALPLARAIGLHNTPCGRCYTMNSMMLYKKVFAAHLRTLNRWIDDPAGFWARFVVEAQRHEFVRLFSFGDIPHPEFGIQLAEACAQCPHTAFWLSTKTLYVPRFHEALRALAVKPNITVRACGILLDADIRREVSANLPDVPGMTYCAVASTGRLAEWDGVGIICPAIAEGGVVRTGAAGPAGKSTVN